MQIRSRGPISKTEAARQQLAQAIRLHFSRGDAVSVYTLASAAAGIIEGLLKARGMLSPFSGGDLYAVEHRARILKLLRAPQNFFKHADNDPDAELELHQDACALRMFEVVFEFELLTGQSFREAQVFSVWFFQKWPNLLRDCEFKDLLKASRAKFFAADCEPTDLEAYQLFLEQPRTEGC
jgi:hypothetical protein